MAVSNGTTALVAALRAHRIGPGAEVITTPLTFVATLNAILEVGAVARFADIGDDLTIDPARLAALVTPRTRALMPVHLFGLPAAMVAISELAHQQGLAIIEDAAQAHGAQVGAAHVGSFGTAAFSFYGTKNITCGEGGIVTTNDDGIALRLRLLRNHGMREPYQYVLPGNNYRLTDLQAVIATAQLGRLPEINDRRARNAARLSEGLGGLAGLVAAGDCARPAARLAPVRRAGDRGRAHGPRSARQVPGRGRYRFPAVLSRACARLRLLSRPSAGDRRSDPPG